MSAWIAQHFLHPSYVLPWGAALAALPVVIHLINRLRYRRVRFAAMDFLLSSQQRNRRRLLIEQLLLLLLRVAVVVGLVALVSRLVLDPSALWVFRGAKAHHLVLLDDSGSMRDRWGETSAFREGLSIVRRLVADGARRPGTQQCTLILLSQTERPLFSKRDVNNAFATELETILERLECTHQSLDLVTGVEAAAKLLADDAGAIRHLHVISDFRAADWGERTALRSAFVAVAKTGASINLARTVSERHENLAITDLSGDVRTAAAGVPVRLKATVRNFGGKVVEGVRLSVSADNAVLPMSVVIERLQAGEECKRDIDVTFKMPGKHTVAVELPEDALPEDGRRFAALDVNLVTPVLIIDGTPESDDGAYVADALAANPSVTGFSTRIEGPDFLRRESLDKYRCLYLLNVPQLPADAVEILADYVRRGGGLAWFLGDVVNTAFYNDVLFAKVNGLFPARLAPNRKDLPHAEEGTLAADLEFADHPVFRVFQGQDNPFIDKVRIHTRIPAADDWVRDDNQRKDDVTTIAFLPGKEPFAFERSFGKGRILAFLTSAGPKWNNWVQNPSVVAFHLELAKYVARDDHSHEQRVVGQPIEVAFDPAEYLDTVEISAPDATGQRMTRLKATRPAATAEDSDAGPQANASAAGPTGKPPKNRPRPEAVRVAAKFPDTDRPGMYVVRLFKDQAAVPQERWVAYNVPEAESDLRTATTAEILARLSGDVHVQIQEPGSFNFVEGHGAGQEARTLLLAFLAAALVAEQFFAYRLSYHPATVKGHPATAKGVA